ncbi:MAG: peptidoglycan DD-metalloendopeptidase family protein [Holosporales bacterium]
MQFSRIRHILAALSLALAVMIAGWDRFIALWHPKPQPQVVIGPTGQVCEITPESALQPAVEPEPQDYPLELKSGDTIVSALNRVGVDQQQALGVAEALRKVYDPRDLRTDHELSITAIEIPQSCGKRDIFSLYIRPSIDEEIFVRQTEDGSFIAEKTKKQLVRQTSAVTGRIQESYYLDASKQNVPAKTIQEAIQAFSFDVDFQRDFQPGDRFEFLYESTTDPESDWVEGGELSYASLYLQGKTIRLFRFRLKDGTTGFYNEHGESVKKGLLRTPIDGARISSKFGHRRHPILGFTKLHTGVDFGAPTGTPVMAAGDGVVEKIGLWGAYGNYIRIRHNSEYSTAYAHLSRYAKGLKPGARVKQGQVIGFVGATGRTTGPHLHYELLRFNKHINPASVKMMPAAKLGGQDMAAFKAFVSKVSQRFQTHKNPPHAGTLKQTKPTQGRAKGETPVS